MKKCILVAAMAITGSAQAQSLYNNATPAGLTLEGLRTEGRADSLGDNSVVVPPNVTFGFTSNAGLRLGDDFTLANGGIVNSINIWSYTTGATAVTMTGGNMEIRTGSVTGAVVATGTFAGAVFDNIYRVTPTTLTEINRRLQKGTFNFSNPVLTAGTYYLTWNTIGTPFSPPLSSPTGVETPGANAQQFQANFGWVPIDPGHRQDMPFWINGQPVPEPGSLFALSLGAVAMMRRRKS